MENELTYKIDKNSTAEIQAAVEVLLFAAGDPVPVEQLADVLEIEKSVLLSILKDLGQTSMAGIVLREINGCFTLSTKPDYDEYIRTLLEPHAKQGLSNAAFETLSIIAYNAPATRARVEEIRGVNSDSAINRLVEKGLIREAGRMEVPGRPVLFEPTDEFLKSFGFTSLDDLPKLEEVLDGMVELEVAQDAIEEENEQL